MFFIDKYNREEGVDLLVAAAFVLASGGVIGAGVSYGTATHEKIKINRVYEKNDSNGQGIFYVVGEKQNGEKEVFENQDSFFYLKYASADLQAKLQVGQTYQVKVNGLRIPFLSMYRNIISADLEPQTATKNNLPQTTDQILEARYANVLLQLLNQTDEADVCAIIKTLTELEALKDKPNALKINAFGNKYTQQYLQLNNKEAFKNLLKQSALGRQITQLIFKDSQQGIVCHNKNNIPVYVFEKARA